MGISSGWGCSAIQALVDPVAGHGGQQRQQADDFISTAWLILIQGGRHRGWTCAPASHSARSDRRDRPPGVVTAITFHGQLANDDGQNAQALVADQIGYSVTTSMAGTRRTAASPGQQPAGAALRVPACAFDQAQ